jgi:alpha-L-rhamnosidase
MPASIHYFSIVGVFILPLLASRSHGSTPYLPDDDTVFLFHLNETAGSSIVSSEGFVGHPGITTDGASAIVTDVIGAAGHFGGAAAFSTARAIGIDSSGDGGFSTAGADRFPLGNLLGPDKAFTLEALVRPNIANFTSHGQIWCADSDASTRGFQFRINSTEELEYNGLNFGGGNVKVSLTGLLQANTWYHAALTYTEAGQPTGRGLFTMYWAPVGGSRTEAQVLHTWTSSAITPGFSSQLVLGNEGRGPMSEGFPGLIDEARISRVARAADEFIFSIVDLDSDLLPDPWEQQIMDANPNDSITSIIHVLPDDDFDSDTLTNQQEYQLGTNPTVANNPLDADGDGLPDVWELTYFPTIWSQNAAGDPDHDTVSNLLEHQRDSSPIIFNDPNDNDLDGLADDWEILHFESLEFDSEDDPDGDGFPNIRELNAGTDPDNVQSVPGDSDGDGLQDTWEMDNFASLSKGANDNPDGDSSNNAAEHAERSDPNDPLDHPGAAMDSGRPTGQMVDLLAFPGRTTVADTRPEFTWIYHPDKRGATQSAYEIIVSSSGSLAGAGDGDVWDSGRVTSGDSVSISYGGAPLTRGNAYFWRVRTWGESDVPSAWSRIQVFVIDSTNPQSGARSVYRASANDSTGYNWAGRYQSDFDTVVIPSMLLNKGGGNYYVDFGKDGFGYLTLRLNGNFLGQTMTVKFSEHASGTSVVDAGGTTTFTSRTVALQNGDITYQIRTPDVSGGGINVNGWTGGVITPFRYVELVGCPGTVTTNDIRQKVLHVPFDDSASAFASSNSTLDAVWEMCKYTMKATSFASIYVDGDRERLPYEADAYINQLSHYGVDREFTTGRYSYEYLLDHSTWPTEWKLHFPLMAWADYMYTSDKEALAVNYASIVNQVNQYSSNERGDGLLNYGSNNNIVDWPTGERDGYTFSSMNNVVNAFYFKSWQLLAQIATELGKTTEAAGFAAQADQMKASFNSVFWNGSQYQDGEGSTNHVSAHANFFPMALGLVPPDRVAPVMTYLKSRKMPCSVYGAQYLLEALFDGGEADHAIGLMADNSTTYDRHWYNMIAKGSTLAMEAWGNNYKPNQDWNHAWGAAPGNIIPRFVLGLKPLTPGFSEAEIKPQLGTGDGISGLTTASGTIPTIRGPVTIQVENSPTVFKLHTKTPGNMKSRILVPSKGHANPALVVNGRVIIGPVVNGHLVLENLPSGEHAIWLSDTTQPTDAVLKENWRVGLFGKNASNSDLAGDSADPDDDGFSNADEYLNGTDPLFPDVDPSDVDNDDLADDWEREYFGNITAQGAEGDPDGDGTDNLTEQRLALDPKDGASSFSAEIDGMRISWPGVEGVSFTIQRAHDATSWDDIHTQEGVDGINSYTETAPLPDKAFYRVKFTH